MAKVLVVTSGKGGVGKITSTAALGAALAQAGKAVAVDRYRRLLRTRCERPCRRRASNDFDKISPAHVTLRSEVKHEASFQSLGA